MEGFILPVPTLVYSRFSKPFNVLVKCEFHIVQQKIVKLQKALRKSSLALERERLRLAERTNGYEEPF